MNKLIGAAYNGESSQPIAENPLLKILVDPAVFRYGPCGFTRYYGALCHGLRLQGAELRVPLVTTNCDFVAWVSPYTRWLRRIPRLPRIMDALSQWFFHREVRSGNYDCILVTSPEFSAALFEHNSDAHAVMVVHDMMSCVTAPDGLYDAAGPGLASLLYLARRASLVVCISEDTRRALASHGIVDSRRIAVVHTGNLLAAAAPSPAVLSLPGSFLLFVGERSGRKGFFSMVQALAPLFLEFPKLTLICTGKLRRAELDYLDAHGMAARVQAMVADDSTLVTLYREAVGLVYPSLYEGFGLPVLEAMHYGCPVITTNRGALAEVAGDAALFVDPFDPASIRDAVRTLLTEPQAVEQLRTCGYKQSARFDASTMMQCFYQAIEASTRRPFISSTH